MLIYGLYLKQCGPSARVGNRQICVFFNKVSRLFGLMMIGSLLASVPVRQGQQVVVDTLNAGVRQAAEIPLSSGKVDLWFVSTSATIP